MIPKKFIIGGLTYQIIQNSQLTEATNYYGSFKEAEQEIHISGKLNNNQVKQESKELTFYHELVHCILTRMGEKELNENEGFVDLFATFLYEFEKTKKI